MSPFVPALSRTPVGLPVTLPVAQPLESASQRRTALAESLRRGLTFSAGLHLTFAVLVLSVLRFVSVPLPEPRRIPYPPDHVVIDVGDPTAAPPVAVPRFVDITQPAVIEPVDVDDPARIEPDTVPSMAARALVEGTGTGITGPQTGPAALESDETQLDPNKYVPHDIEPSVLTRVLPEYPPIAQMAGVEGRVVVRVLVGASGAVRKVEVEDSAAMFDEAAVDAVRKWTFRPAEIGGKPVAVWYRIPIVFRMN